MIPDDRPVTGNDISNIKQAFGMLSADAGWVFGMSPSKWTNVVRKNGAEPLSDPTLALLARLLAQHPELSLLPKWPSVQEMMEMVNSIQETDSRRFSIMMGAESGAAYRWRRPGQRAAANVGRLMYYLKMVLQAQPPEKRGPIIDEWRKTVDKEAQARGIPDIIATGSWTNKTPKVAVKRTRAKKKAEA